MSVDMRKVRVGTQVMYRNGGWAFITSFDLNCTYPFCSNKRIFHRPDGSCCVDNMSEYDIVEILDDVKTQQPLKTPRKRSAPLYNELLNERELLKIENHNIKVQLDTVKNSTLFGVLTWWFHNRKGEWK